MSATQRSTGVLLLVLIVSAGISQAQTTTQDELLKKSLAAFRAGDTGEALRFLDELLKVDPKHPTAWRSKGIVLNRSGRYAEEIQCYDRHLALVPKDAAAWSNRAAALGRLERYAEAEKSFNTAATLDPKDAFIYSNRGVTRFKAGNYDRALADLQKAKTLGILEHQPDVEQYILWCRRILRQLAGQGTPPLDWKPDYGSYHTDVSAVSKGNLLIDMPGPDYRPAPSEGGLTSLAGLGGTRMSFAGTEREPFLYAPRFYVWNGAVINDPKFGVLLDNGTQFSYSTVGSTGQITRKGVIRGWKAVVLTQDPPPPRKAAPAASSPTSPPRT